MYGRDRLGIGRLRAALFVVGLPAIALWSLRGTPLVDALITCLPAALLATTALMCGGAAPVLGFRRSSVAAVAAAVIAVATVMWSVPASGSLELVEPSHASSRRQVLAAFGPIALGLLVGVAIAWTLEQLRTRRPRARSALTATLFALTLAVLAVPWPEAAQGAAPAAPRHETLVALRADPTPSTAGPSALVAGLTCAGVAALTLAAGWLLARRSDALRRARQARMRDASAASLGAYRDSAKPDPADEPELLDLLFDRSLALHAVAIGALLAAHGVLLVATTLP